MQKHRNTVLVWFFIASVVIIIFRMLTTAPLDPSLQEAETSLQRKRFELKARNLERNDRAVFYGAMVLLGTVCLSLVVIAVGVHRERVKKASVHTYQIGNSTIMVHERDLSLAWPIATGLMNAEKLEKMNGGIEKALALYQTMAEVQTQQIRAFLGRRGLQPALPASLSSEVLPTRPEQIQIQIPTVTTLLKSGIIAPGQPLLFGYAHDIPKTGTWQDIFSNATGGQGGSGKTNTLRGLILQSILQGVQFWILDYHWPHDESLLASLGALKDGPSITYADKHIDYVPILEEVDHTIDMRIRKTESCEVVKVLVIDEVLQVVKHVPYTEDIIERIGTEGRKLNVFGLFSAQSWKADKVNTTARDNLTSIFAHHMTKNQAKILLQDIEQAKMVSTLKSGQMLYRPVNADPEILSVPWCDQEAVRLVANMVVKPGNGATMTRPGNGATMTRPGNGATMTRPGNTVDNTSSNGKATDIQIDYDIVANINNLLTHPDLSISQIAKQIQINKGHLSRVLRGERSLTPEIREKLERWKQHYESHIITFPNRKASRHPPPVFPESPGIFQ